MSSLVPGKDRLGRYRLVRELGVGAMGTVYLADAEGESVAVKVLHPHVMRVTGSLERFQREFEAGTRIHHPNVVRTLDAGTAVVNGTSHCYLAMECVEGRTLRALLDEWRSVPEALLREIARQAAAGLAAIHQAGIVHRDLKPENILITKDHCVRIMDLGVARLADATATLSKEGLFRGSLPYGAPEQFRGEPVDAAADLYSLGVLLYELATGTNPFHFDEMGAIVRAHLDLEPPPASEGEAEVSPFLSEILATLLAKRQADRLPSAASLLGVLEAGEDAAWWRERQEAVRARGPVLPNVPVRRETRLYGREDDLARLQRCWVRARAGEGCVALIEGEAGIGKSRLVDTFLRGLDDANAHVLYGSYSPSGGLGGISDALTGRFGEDGLEAALRRYAGSMSFLVPSLAAALLHRVPPLDAHTPTGDTLAAGCAEIMRGLAAEKPLVWVVEDLHFAEPERRKRALSLARAVAGHRVLLLLTTRPGLPEEELQSFGRVGELVRTGLGRLGAREVVLLLQDAFHSEILADRLGARIALKSDGIPFFVFEMIRELKEDGYIRKAADGSWIESKVIDEIQVPSAVKDLIEVRVSVLTKEERAILDVGAVQGYVFDPRIAAEILERRPVAVLQDLGHVERHSGIVRAQGRAYRFDHHQIQEVVYADLSDGLREEYHAALADAIRQAHENAAPDEPWPGEKHATVCRHYLEGGRGLEARPHLKEALAFLGAVHLPDEAVSLAERALATPRLLESEQRAEILLSTAETLHLLGRTEEERRVLDEAVALTDGDGDTEWKARSLEGLGRWLQHTAAYEEALRITTRAVDVAKAAGSLECEARALRTLGLVCYAQGDFEASRRYHERNVEIARTRDDPLEEANAIGGLGTALSRLGRHHEALRCFEKHLEVARARGARLLESTAHGNLGVALSDLGRYDEAAKHFEEQLVIGKATGNRHAEARATGYLAYVDVMQGRTKQALRRYEQECAIARETGDQRAEALATGNQGTCLLRLGRMPEARDCFERWLAVARETGNRSAEARANGQLGHLCTVQGRYEEARTRFQTWLEISKEGGDKNGEASATGYLGGVLAREGRHEEAYAMKARHLQMREEMGSPRGACIAAIQLGHTAFDLGRIEEALSLFERSLGIAHEIGDKENECVALQARSQLAALFGRTQEALADLEVAARLADEMEYAERLALIAGNRGLLYFRLGRLEEARAHIEKRLAFTRGAEDDRGTSWMLVQRGRLHAEAGRTEQARSDYEEALAACDRTRTPDLFVFARCLRSLLPDGSREEALAAFAEEEARLDVPLKMEVCFLLYKATADRAFRTAARRHLDALVAASPKAYRETMRRDVPLHREILEATEGDAAPL